jgi:hypothetical protein
LTSIPALDVALGLSFAYFLFSILATTATETVSRFTQKRARDLERWLEQMLAGPEGEKEAYTAFLDAPIMRSLLISTGRLPRTTAKPGKARPRPPSYIPSPHFVNAVLSVGRDADRDLKAGLSAWRAIGADLEREPIAGTVAGQALREIYNRAGGDVIQFRRDAESWFDDQMERLSGVYKRWSQWIVWGVGFAVVLALNANSIRMAETLWNDPSSRQAIVAAAGSAKPGESVAQAQSDIGTLPLPLGWNGNGYHHFWGWAFALAGALITLGAISLGAPFWFDTLSRLARLRSTGAPPPASNATRSGEGDQTRGLPDVTAWKPLGQPEVIAGNGFHGDERANGNDVAAANDNAATNEPVRP